MYKVLLMAFMMAAIVANAQKSNKDKLSVEDYARAESYLSYNTAPYLDRAFVRPHWISDSKFWYRILTAEGSEFILVDAEKGKRRAAFDQKKLAEELTKRTGKNYFPMRLPFFSIQYTNDLSAIQFKAAGKDWVCNLKKYVITEQHTSDSSMQRRAASKREKIPGVVSPDGKKRAFIKEYNLWVEDLSSGKQVQLTTDGIKDFGYATDNAGWVHSDRAILKWSPDSKKIATFKQDQRNVNNMYLVTTNVGAPKLESWKYEFPGDTAIFKIQRCIIDVDSPRVVFLKIPADPHRATLSDDIASSGSFDDVDWSADSRQLAFVSTSRDHKIEKVRMADAGTGAVREIFEEKVPTQFESGWGAINWSYLSKTQEIIWFSERDNWGHLYLYDANTGKLKNQITKGDWLVSKVLRVDAINRKIYFMANGLEKENPYFAQFCSIHFDGSHFKVLTPESGDHKISLSPGGQYIVDAYSKPNVSPVTLLKDTSGQVIDKLEEASVKRLIARGWKPVTPFKVKAADGKTDLYGLLYLPSHLDPTKKYPLIDYIYPGPQGGSVGSWSFAATRGDNQALAELGFVVIQLEGSSNPLRSKSFHDMSYGNMATNTLADQIAAIRQLARRYPYVDTSRIGIWGHSGGGFATAAAMFKYPEFFKVGIAESGNHDNRNYEADWGERYNGLVANADYEAQANQKYAKNLKGKLLLVHGMMDNNVPPQNTLLVVEALEKANKDFDLIVFPNSRHGYGPYSGYMMRRRWDYFVENLLGKKPPKEYQLKRKKDPRNVLP